MTIGRQINDLIVALLNLERRLDPFFRDEFNRLFQGPLSDVVQFLINLTRTDEHLALAEERLIPGEGEMAAEIVEQMSAFLRDHYPAGPVLRAGNTKTYGVVAGTFAVRPDLPPELRVGVFATPNVYRAWVRFAGPGPLAPPDVEDNGLLSIGIKLVGVAGEKLIDDERFTQDFTAITCPTFTTPNVVENVKLQRHVRAGTPVLYFLSPFDSHYRDAAMQALYSRVNTSPLEVRYYSCVPYLFGEGRAVKYTVRPRPPGRRTPVPWDPPNDYLRRAMAATLAREVVEFDVLVQFQTDAHRMPIENASVRWPENVSPFVPVATLRLPAQRFDSPAQVAFAGNLSFNPWHAVAAHRPLGSLNRARRHLYLALSMLRQQMNGEARLEPTGDEDFGGGPTPNAAAAMPDPLHVQS